MDLAEYIQVNLPRKYWKSGCGLFICNVWYDIDLITRLDDNRFVNNGPYKYWLQPQLLFWNKWVSENVFSDKNMCDTNIKTNSVLIRIATGMINKLSYITEDEKRRLHDLLIEFYTERKRVYMDYHYMEVLGFPF